MKRLLRSLAFVLFAAGWAGSQIAVVTRNVNLRPDPSTGNTPIDKLTPETKLTLIETGATNGFLHVKFNAESGWVWSRNVRIRQASPPNAGGGSTPIEGATATTIASDWDKPLPQVSSFNSDEGACGGTGEGGDSDTNRRKNRIDVPDSYHSVAWEAINSLDYAKSAPKRRSDWTSAQLATISPFEGSAITVEGFLYKVKVESSSPGARRGGESTNCHAHLASDVDWHMPLTANLEGGEDVAVIVETTPRVRKSHANWTTTRLKPWAAHVGNHANADYNEQKVRISGWLMLDPEHQGMINNGLRSTLWEIHPITKIEVWDNGSWVDLDSP